MACQDWIVTVLWGHRIKRDKKFPFWGLHIHILYKPAIECKEWGSHTVCRKVREHDLDVLSMHACRLSSVVGECHDGTHMLTLGWEDGECGNIYGFLPPRQCMCVCDGGGGLGFATTGSL